ncbi:flagellar motor switch protein FliM [Parvibaculum sp.]|jgi:flagellar motor switch protein FliM|uniref:flagellar motor switch protein FliM n=1 Tax=Parvibaculum sp. TaxID=2024848 RepID=UPI002A276A74|nr:flagellar motor switch protein FliM [Parvibaculum sp.]
MSAADTQDFGKDALAAAAEAAAKVPERVLNQDEIDSLLGFEMDDDVVPERHGIDAIVNSALVSYERLPMLEIVFDRLVRLMTVSLRNFTSDNVEVSLDNVSSIRFGDYLNSIPLPAILAVFRAKQWDNYGMFTVDSNLIYSIVDVLLGGRRGTAAMRIEGRPYTTIELNLVQRMIEVVLQDVQAAFEPLSPVTLEFDRMETNPRFAAIARPANAAILVRLRVDMEDRGGRIEMMLPYATLEPIRELLLQMFMGEKFGRDSIWESHLATELWSTRVPLEAVLDEQKLTLRDVMNFEPGQTLMLNNGPDGTIDLRCGGVRLGTGRMGRVGNHVAVRVEQGIRHGKQAAMPAAETKIPDLNVSGGGK